MRVHPAAKLLPSISTADFIALKEDIRKHGVIEPAWVKDGKLLDGRNRWRACQELKIKCPTREYRGDDVRGFVLSANLMRRHLSQAQKRAVILMVLKQAPQMSNAALGKQLHVDHETISRVRKRGETHHGLPRVTRRVGTDGVAKEVNVSVRAPAMRPRDLDARRILKQLRAILAAELSDPQGFITELAEQVERLRAAGVESTFQRSM